MRIAIFLAVMAVSNGCTSVSTAPSATALPTFAFSSLKGTTVAVVVLDQRAGERDVRWKGRIESDVRAALVAAGVQVSPEAPTRFEVRLLRARSDSEAGQWKGCAELTGRVVGARNADGSGDSCVSKANLWGKGTADNVLRLAYEDALIKVLSALDSKL